MDWLLWILLGLALLLALSARKQAKALQSTVDQLRRDAVVNGGASEELRKEFDVLRKLSALMAGGKDVAPEMIKENRLYRNVAMAQVQSDHEAGKSPYVVDVRTEQEWNSGHIPGAQHIPVDELEARLNEVARDGRTIFVTCAGGGRSTGASEYLANRGFLNVFNVEGGMNGWRGEVDRGS